MHLSTASRRSDRGTYRFTYVPDPDDAFSPASGMHAETVDAGVQQDVFTRSIIAVFVRTAIMSYPLPPRTQPLADIPAGC
jgi:hypothetical protein